MGRKLFLFALFIILVAVLAIAIWQGWSHHEAVWTWLEWLVIPQWPDWMMGWVQTLLNITIVIIAVAVIVGLVLGLVWLYRRMPAATPHPAIPAPGPVPPAPAPAPTPTPARLARRGWPWGKMILGSIVLGLGILIWSNLEKESKLWWEYQVGDYLPWRNQETVVLSGNGWSQTIEAKRDRRVCIKAISPVGETFKLKVNNKQEYTIVSTEETSIRGVINYVQVSKDPGSTSEFVIVRITFKPLNDRCDR
jgi:hypothetical protein